MASYTSWMSWVMAVLIIFSLSLSRSSADINAEDVCRTGIDAICSSGNIPVSAALKMCPQESCVPVPVSCHHKVEMCVGPRWARRCWEQCVPGTKDQCVTVNVPCGFDVQRIGVCDAAGALVERARANCGCINAVKNFYELGLEQTMNSGDLSQATSNAISAFATSQACIINAGFNVQNNKADALQSPEFSEGSNPFHVVSMGPEIDTAFYVDVITRVVQGVTTGKWDDLVDLMLQKFDAVKQTGADLWNRLATRVTQQVNTVVSAAQAVFDAASTVPSFSAEPSLQHLRDLITAGTAAVSAVSAANEFAASLASTDYRTQLLSLLTSGRAPALTNLFDVFSQADTALQSVGKLQQLGGAVSAASSALPALQSAASSATADQQQALQSSLSNLQTQLAAISLHSVDLRAGVKAYNSWADVSFELPCTRVSQKCLGEAGCFNYPEIYSCTWARRVPFPNQFLTYLELAPG